MLKTTECRGIRLSGLTLGTVQLGLAYGINNQSGLPSEQKSFDILQAAWDSGVCCYDTATTYGQAENLVGRFFAGRQPTVMTKLHAGKGSGDPADIELEMRKQVETSLRNLHMDSIPIMMLHNTDAMQAHGEAITAGFAALKRDGLIQLAGISVSFNQEDEYRALWPYLRHETFDAIQLPMNVLDHRPLNNGCLQMLKEAGKLVFVRSVFLQGLLYLQDEAVPVYLEEAREPLARLRELSQRYGVPISQMAVSYIRDMPGVHSLIIGAETPEQVQANVRLLEGPQLPEALTGEIRHLFSDVSELVVTPHLWPELKKARS